MVTMLVLGENKAKMAESIRHLPVGDRFGESLNNLYGGNPFAGAGTEMQMADRTWPVRRSWQESRSLRGTTGYVGETPMYS